MTGSLIQPSIKDFHYLVVEMDNHMAHYRIIKGTKSQLELINQIGLILNARNIEIKQIRVGHFIFLVAYDITNSKPKIMQAPDGRYYMHRDLLFFKKDKDGNFASLDKKSAYLIAKVAGKIIDYYGKAIWTLPFNNFVNPVTNVNELKPKDNK